LNALVSSFEGDFRGLEQELDRIESLARKKGDDPLRHLVRLVHYRLLWSREAFTQEHARTVTALAKTLNGYLKADALQLLADHHWASKEYTAALEHYLNAYDLYSRYDVKEFPPKPDYLYECGGKYYYFGDYATAKKYFQEALQSVTDLKSNITKINTLALCYDFLGQLDSAAYYYDMAMKVAIENDDDVWIGILSGNIADIHYKRKDYDQAVRLLEESVRLNLENHVLQNAVYSLSLLGDIHLIRGENKRALELQLQAYEIIKEKKKWNTYAVVKRVYPYIARAYAANGNMAMAYAFLDSATAAKDSVASERNLLYLAGAQHKTEAQRHMAELREKEASLKMQTTIRNGLIGGFVLVGFFSVILLRQKRRITAEKKRSDELLLNILPEETAEELKQKGTAEARSYDLVTVMFTDFKDFSLASEKMEAKELVREIHSFYMAFDRIIDIHNIEKIKTIGDSYMCAGGLPVVNRTNAEDVLKAAVEIQQFMQRDREERERRNAPVFQIRIGIHTGSVVAGIVGIRKFAYDIWGDTVNIASRMQSSGEVGKINISGSTYELVKHKFKCTYRGKVAAKNKGEIDMYFVADYHA
jgi:class 3 adenylate cyclase